MNGPPGEAGARSPLLAVSLLWLLVVGISLALRPLWPVDETRYAAVAWEMWNRGDFLVPHLNGQPYSHKPPLLFWLIHLGWALFGVNDVWPRLVPPAACLGSLFLAGGLARRLSARTGTGAEAAPLLLFGCLLFTLFSAVLTFDMLLTFWVLAAHTGTLLASEGRRRGFLLLGLAVGAGILSKGPVTVLHALPPALLAPWWAPSGSVRRWSTWYLGVLAATGIGAGIALAWAIPAASAGGDEYARAILWQQSAGRVVQSFAHRRPVWWLLPWVLPALLPYSLWPPLWRGVRRLSTGRRGVRFCLAWIASTLLLISLPSGKQVYYLVPLLPAFALLACLSLEGVEVGRRDQRLPALFLVALGGAAALLPHLPWSARAPAWLASVSPAWGAVIALSGAGLALFPARSARGGILALSTASALLVATVHAGWVRAAVPAYDVRPVARILHKVEEDGRSAAVVNGYAALYIFEGRLTRPLESIEENDVGGWLAAHPDGVAVVFSRDPGAFAERNATYLRPFRGKYVGVLAGRPAPLAVPGATAP